MRFNEEEIAYRFCRGEARRIHAQMWWLVRLGAIGIYLDVRRYSAPVWIFYFRPWNPLTWIIVAAGVVECLFTENTVRDVVRIMNFHWRCPEPQWDYQKAPESRNGKI